jgi:hypothetical protein
MGYFHSFMNGMYLSFLIFTPRFMKFYKVVSKTTLESYCYYFLRGGLQCTNEGKCIIDDCVLMKENTVLTKINTVLTKINTVLTMKTLVRNVCVSVGMAQW